MEILNAKIERKTFVMGYWRGNSFLSDRRCTGKYGITMAPNKCCVFKDLLGGVFCNYCNYGFDKKFLIEKNKIDVDEIRRSGGFFYEIIDKNRQKRRFLDKI